ncbi:hypothetical protein L1887_22715 [Cichorium endivia]|nr:hypothetical protein L1887_22715 [Cichorium endivia]
MVGTLSGADFDAEVAEIRASMVNEVNELGETALYTVAENGHLEVVKELLKYSENNFRGQWTALIRSYAKVVAYDDFVFPVFKRLCKQRPPLDASKGKQNIIRDLQALVAIE